MNFVYAFIFGGLLCLIAQFMLDKFKLLPVHITVLFVIFGCLLEFFNIYDSLIEIGYSGFLVPISSFGHSLAHASYKGAVENGIIGAFTKIFDLTSGGISIALLSAFVCSLIFKVKS